MSIQSYIESGLIEGYVLGIISAEEKKDVELMAEQHTEIKAAIKNFEEIFEKKKEAYKELKLLKKEFKQREKSSLVQFLKHYQNQLARLQ